MNTQTTFTKQKRELAKANSLIQSIRAQEVRSIRFDKDGKQQTIERSAYVTETPEAIAQQVLEIVRAVVAQHGARQQANSVNKGHFEFAGIQAELTVPQLRTLQDSLSTLTALVNKLPAENLRLVPNGELDGRPAFFHPVEDVTATKTRNVLTKRPNRPACARTRKSTKRSFTKRSRSRWTTVFRRRRLNS